MLAIIAGTGLQGLLGQPVGRHTVSTPFGMPSSELRVYELADQEVYVLPRHGDNGGIYAHVVNYQANIYALKELNVSGVIATATVGAIAQELSVGDLVIPDQIIDYTSDRQHTFSDELKTAHFDFTYPFTEEIRQCLIESHPSTAHTLYLNSGTYACMQGPRLETAAEIKKLAQDGCDLVGMTLMPEAALARELEIPYAAICLVVNAAAGIEEGTLVLAEAKQTTTKALETIRDRLLRTAEILK